MRERRKTPGIGKVQVLPFGSMAENEPATPEDEVAALEALIRDHHEHEIEACEELADFSENALNPWGGRTIKKAAIDDPPVADGSSRSGLHARQRLTRPRFDSSNRGSVSRRPC